MAKFWGLRLDNSGKRYAQKVGSEFCVTMAILDAGDKAVEPLKLFVEKEKTKLILCKLSSKMQQSQMNVKFGEGESIALYFEGGGDGAKVHLSGYRKAGNEDSPAPFKGSQQSILVNENVKGKRKAKKSVSVEDAAPHVKETSSSEDMDEDGDDDEFMKMDDDEVNENGSNADSDNESDPEDVEEEEDDEDEDESRDDYGNNPSMIDVEAIKKDLMKTGLLNELDGEDDDDENDAELDELEPEEPEPVKLSSKKKKKKNKSKVAEVNAQSSPVNAKQNEKRKSDALKTPDNQNAKLKQPSSAGHTPFKSFSKGGVMCQEVLVGNQNGPIAKSGKMVTVYYSGRLKSNNKLFDSSLKGEGFKFRLGKGEVIKGWDLGVEGMKVGGKRKLTIPANLAYGKNGMPPAIPPNATLVFDVELRNVK